MIQKRLGKFIKGIGLILRNPWLINRVLDDPGVNQSAVKKQFGKPDGLSTIKFTDLCGDGPLTVQPFAALDGGSTPHDLALLVALCSHRQGCQYFEIGTWRGESAANVARVAANVVTLNLPDDEMRQRGLDKEYIDLHRFFSKQLPNVTHLQANSLSFDFTPHHKKYDVIFVDGDHHYESVRADSSKAFQLLKDENSVIVWHDYLDAGGEVRWDVLRGILEGTPKEHVSSIYHVSNTLCAIFYKGSLKASKRPLHETPEKAFEITITARSAR